MRLQRDGLHSRRMGVRARILLFSLLAVAASGRAWADTRKQDRAPVEVGCATSGVRPSLAIERFAGEPARFDRALRAVLRRPPADLMRTSRAAVAEVRVDARGQCALVLTPEATARHATWLRALAQTEMRGALIVRVGDRGRGAPFAIPADESTASGVLPFACGAARVPLCSPPRGATATRTLPGLGVRVDAPADWSWRASPAGMFATAGDGTELPIRIGTRAPGEGPPSTMVLETGASFARARGASEPSVIVALPLGERAVVCTTVEAYEDVCASLRRLGETP